MSSKKVVVIMTDSQRWDMLGCYGNEDMATPNLDRLAGEGMRFERAYTTCPVCGPARSAIFTGQFPHSNGSVTNSAALAANTKTVGQRVADNGYHAAYIGKWHLDGGDYFGTGRCPEGWDETYWYDMRCYLEELCGEERLLSRQASANQCGIDEAFTYAHRCSGRAVDFLENYGKDDFLLVVSFDEPHDPYLCPEPYASMYNNYSLPKAENVMDTLEGKPDHQKVWAGEEVHKDRALLKLDRYGSFLGCNAFVDHEIGRVLEAVDTFAEDALVLYTSDHGDFLGSHCLAGKGPAAYDEITRIPMIARWKGTLTPGKVYPHPVSHIEITPTILHAMGIAVPKLLEGKSLLPAFEKAETRINDCIFMEFSRYEIDHDGFGGFQPLRSVFDGRHKLTINLLSGDELYDLQSDPGEMKNLIESEEYMGIRDALHDRLLQWMNDTRDPLRGYYWERRSWRKDAAPAAWKHTGMTRQREHEEYEPHQLDYDTGLPMESAVRRK